MMLSHGRTLLHLTVLALLVAGVLYGAMMVLGFLMMIAAVAMGRMPVGELGARDLTFGVLMTLLWGGVIVAGFGSLARQSRRSLDLARWVDRRCTAPSPRLAAATAAARCPGPVVEVPSEQPYAFTQGIWTPRVVVSSALVARAEDAELVAVLRHEGSHVRHRDPLKVLALRTWGSAFAFVPLVPALFRGMLDRQELRADRSAAAICGVPPVAGALLKAVGEPDGGADTAVAAMGGPSLLETRIAHLETGRVPGLVQAVRPAVLPSLPGIAVVAVYAVLLYQVCLAAQMCCRYGYMAA